MNLSNALTLLFCASGIVDTVAAGKRKGKRTTFSSSPTHPSPPPGDSSPPPPSSPLHDSKPPEHEGEDVSDSSKMKNPYRNKRPSLKKVMVAKPMSSPQKMRKKPNDVWVEGARGNVVLVYVSKASSPDKAAYIWEFQKELLNPQSKLYQAYQSFGPLNAKFMGVIPRRSPSGDNCEMAKYEGSEYAFFQFAFCFQSQDDVDNTVQNRKHIAEKFTEDINEVAAQQFQYSTRFEFAGDRTDTEGLPPPSAKMLNDDVMRLMDLQYEQYSREVLSEELHEIFFGAWPNAKTFIKDYPEKKNE